MSKRDNRTYAIVGDSAAAPVGAYNPDAALLEILERDLPAANSRTIAARWALYVVKACLAEDDLKTLADWARVVGVSYTSLRESCYLLDIRPHDARDFARVMRAVLRSSSNGWDPARYLDVADRRTMSTLLERSGLKSPQASRSLFDQFLEGQSFIDRANAGVLRLVALLRGEMDAESRHGPTGLP